jgi:hypothetical protein
LQHRQLLDVDMNEAEVVVAELPRTPGRTLRGCGTTSVQPLGLEDAPDAVAVEVRQEVPDDEGQIIEGEVGPFAQQADHRAVLRGGLPGQVVGAGGAVEAVGGPALAPLADGLGADAVALRQ